MIGDKEAITATAQALQDKVRRKTEVTPPYDGLFFITDELTTIELKFELYDLIEYDEYKAMPVIAEKLPVFVLMSTEINLDEFYLYKGRPTFGIRIDSSSSPCNINYSSNPNFQIDDKILSIDETQISDCDQLFAVMDSKQPFSTISVELQRGTHRETYEMDTQGVVLAEKIEYVSQYVDNNYIAIYPKVELDSAIYCFGREGWSQYGFCFYVE